MSQLVHQVGWRWTWKQVYIISGSPRLHTHDPCSCSRPGLRMGGKSRLRCKVAEPWRWIFLIGPTPRDWRGPTSLTAQRPATLTWTLPPFITLSPRLTRTSPLQKPEPWGLKYVLFLSYFFKKPSTGTCSMHPPPSLPNPAQSSAWAPECSRGESWRGPSYSLHPSDNWSPRPQLHDSDASLASWPGIWQGKTGQLHLTHGLYLGKLDHVGEHTVCRAFPEEPLGLRH